MVEALGRHLIYGSKEFMGFTTMVTQTILGIFVPPYRFKEVIRQIYYVANQSLFVVVFCVSFAAIVTILEASFHMKIVIKNDALVPGFAALLILRELGAVVAALLITSKVGAGIAAEVGSMQITEQIDALKILGIQPIRFLVVPRFLACIVSGFLLAIVANVVCVYCAMLVSESYLGYSTGMFISAMNRFVDFKDLVFAGIKGACFGSVIPLIGCFYGFRCQAGAEGVGRATTNSVVTASVTILVIDFVLSWTFSHFY